MTINDNEREIKQFIDEVDSDIKKDQWAGVWRRYRGLILGTVFAILFVSGGYFGFKQYQIYDAEAKMQQYYEAVATFQGSLSSEKQDVINANLDGIVETIDQMPDQLAAIARFHLAGYFLMAKDKPKAIQALEAISQASGSDALYRDLATLMLALQQFESLDDAFIKNRLEPMIHQDHPWWPLAAEIRILKAIESKDSETANKLLDQLINTPQLPRGFYERAQSLRMIVQ